jgi:hypothetical protein
MKKLRNKMVKVKTIGADRELAKRLNPGASDDEIDSFAAIRAVTRMVACEKKSTLQTLDVITAEVPRKTLEAWTEQRLKAAWPEIGMSNPA